MTRLTFPALFNGLSHLTISILSAVSCPSHLVWFASQLVHLVSLPPSPVQSCRLLCGSGSGGGGGGWRCKVQGGWPFFSGDDGRPNPLPLQSNRLPQRSGSSSSRSVFLQGSLPSRFLQCPASSTAPRHLRLPSLSHPGTSPPAFPPSPSPNASPIFDRLETDRSIG
jgi:hypothetical protein